MPRDGRGLDTATELRRCSRRLPGVPGDVGSRRWASPTGSPTGRGRATSWPRVRRRRHRALPTAAGAGHRRRAPRARRPAVRADRRRRVPSRRRRRVDRRLGHVLGSPAYWAAWGALDHSVRTGGNAFRHVHGTDVWTYRAATLSDAARFDGAMASLSARTAREAVAAYDFTGFGTIVDMGGGTGSLLARILAAAPAARVCCSTAARRRRRGRRSSPGRRGRPVRGGRRQLLRRDPARRRRLRASRHPPRLVRRRCRARSCVRAAGRSPTTARVHRRRARRRRAQRGPGGREVVGPQHAGVAGRARAHAGRVRRPLRPLPASASSGSCRAARSTTSRATPATDAPLRPGAVQHETRRQPLLHSALRGLRSPPTVLSSSGRQA